MRQIYKLSTTTTSKKTASSSYALSKSVSSHQIKSVPTTPNYWPSPATGFGLQKSLSTTDVIESDRGFKPSDRKDPQKKEFLTSLTKRVFKVGMVSFAFLFLNN